MTPAEVAKLLAAAKSMDDRVTVDQERVAAWCAVLDPAMPYEYARDRLLDHYRQSTDSILPAAIQKPWKREADLERARLDGRAKVAEFTAAKRLSIPAPVADLDRLRADLLDTTETATAAARQARTVRCSHCGADIGTACTVVGSGDRITHRDSRSHPARERRAALQADEGAA